MAAASASVAPAVITISPFGSNSWPRKRARCSLTARRRDGIPGSGGYWLCPLRIACRAAWATSSGPSVSGNPWPRLTDCVSRARADIWVKIVVPKPWRRSVRNGLEVTAGILRPAPSHNPHTFLIARTWWSHDCLTRVAEYR